MTIKAVIFDFGGVIIPGEGGPNGMFARLEALYSLTPGVLFRALYLENEGWHRRRIGQGSEAEWEEVCRANLRGLTSAEAAAAIMAGWTGSPAPGAGESRPAPSFNEGMLALVGRLRTRYTVSLLSNAKPGLEDDLRDHYRIHDLFHDAINSATVGLAKPDQRIYHLAAARLALPPEACFFTDDLAHNIEAARGMGFEGHVFEGVDGLVVALRAAGVETG